MIISPGPALGPETVVHGLRLKKPFEWTTRPGLRLFYMDNAMQEFLSQTSGVSVPGNPFSISYREIIRREPWGVTQDELNEVPFPEVLPQNVAALIEGQWNGEEGPLLTTGGNCFCCGGVMVHLYRTTNTFNSSVKEWCVYPWQYESHRCREWFGYGLAFSMPKTA